MKTSVRCIQLTFNRTVGLHSAPLKTSFSNFSQRYVGTGLSHSIPLVVRLVKEYKEGFESRYIEYPTPLSFSSTQYFITRRSTSEPHVRYMRIKSYLKYWNSDLEINYYKSILLSSFDH
ncbi:hypothetical protein BpHYR1_044432 [Brachionus plicatilis]|uniref:Uncharacterized protein n=1 Tax=Brachionus plicatilis TaxID=10195 RepID=A0A3M7PBA1_BRAPC|nr:hypothetical protein BpHYR1_044432 [Brachionus plicatilis]